MRGEQMRRWWVERVQKIGAGVFHVERKVSRSLGVFGYPTQGGCGLPN
jgi:hypothetical protein